jgi:chorismate synthase
MSTFGNYFRVTTFGESHCAAVGCIIDGCPPGMRLEASDIQPQLTRRRPGQSSLTTPRNESDMVIILSGTENGVTLGTPIGIEVKNSDQRPNDYGGLMSDIPRPSHADYTYLKKYGVKASSGGGRSSARETIGRVAAGAIAEVYLKRTFGIEIIAFVSSVGNVSLSTEHIESFIVGDKLSREIVDSDVIRCPVLGVAERMKQVVSEAKSNNDSVGGTITCILRNVPEGLGEPCFDKLEAKLAHAMLSIPATKGFEIGSGFEGSKMFGHDHNDVFVTKSGGDSNLLSTLTNRSGGIQGGISNGENIYFKVAFKPPATINRAQQTVNYKSEPILLEATGRHDPCVVPRAVPIVEAMSALVIMDALMIQLSRVSISRLLPPLNMKGRITADGDGKPSLNRLF